MPSYVDSMSGGPRYSSLTGSVSSVGSNPMTSRQQVSVIAKSYRQAVQLYLTRRLPEALSTIEPVITPELTPHELSSSGETSGDERERRIVAPIAAASRGTRIKVWSFYLTFLNAAIELGPEEGKHTFGSTRWKGLVSKVRDGTIWEEVVKNGYGGEEGEVDPDVVVNLSTLLLTHAPSQKLNQARLENFLSITSNPSFSISPSQLSGHTLQRRSSNSSHHNGTSTPRDLNTRLKLIELYTLHVLPKNREWAYARDFIMMSEILDDERKETFLQGLHHLHEESEQTEQRERELTVERERQLELQRQEEEEARRQEEARERDRRAKEEAEQQRAAQAKRTGLSTANERPPEVPGPSHHGSRLANPPSKAIANQRGTRPPPKKAVPSSTRLFTRMAAVVGAVQALVLSTAKGARRNPLAYMRTILLLLAFILAFAKEDIRERVKRWLKDAWEKVLKTVGMGVKVSYI